MRTPLALVLFRPSGQIGIRSAANRENVPQPRAGVIEKPPCAVKHPLGHPPGFVGVSVALRKVSSTGAVSRDRRLGPFLGDALIESAYAPLHSESAGGGLPRSSGCWLQCWPGISLNPWISRGAHIL